MEWEKNSYQKTNKYSHKQKKTPKNRQCEEFNLSVPCEPASLRGWCRHRAGIWWAVASSLTPLTSSRVQPVALSSPLSPGTHSLIIAAPCDSTAQWCECCANNTIWSLWRRKIETEIFSRFVLSTFVLFAGVPALDFGLACKSHFHGLSEWI